MDEHARWAKPTLAGELVTLRPMSIEDAESAWEMVNDPQGNDLTDTVATFTFDQIRDWCATRAEQDERLDLAIVENSTGEFVGEAVLNEYDSDRESANFRIALRGPAWFGRGLGTEATKLIVDHGLGPVGLRTITLGVLARNPRAQRAYEKAGFRRTEGTVEDGEAWVHMAITAESIGRGGEAKSADRLPDRVHSPRLTLRRWVDTDAEAMSSAITASLGHLRPWMPWAAFEPATAEQRRDLIRQGQTDWERGGDAVFGVFLAGVVIGGAGLHRRIGPDGLEIGYWIHPDHTRQGYATEAAAALTSAALAIPVIERVEIVHDKANVASEGVPRRLGFEFVSESPREVTAPGEIGIGCRWRMTEPRWAQRSAGVRSGQLRAAP